MANATKQAERRLAIKQNEMAADQTILANEQTRLRNASTLNLTLEEQQEQYQKVLDLMAKINATGQTIAGMHQRIVSLKQQELDAAQKAGSLSQAEIDAQTKIINLHKNEYEQQVQINREKQRELTLRRRAIALQEKLRAKTQLLVTTLTGVDSQWQETFIGLIGRSAGSMEGLRASLATVVGAMKESLSVMNVLAGTFSKVIQTTVAMGHSLDSVTTAFRVASGAGMEYNSRILAVFENNRRFGIGLRESGMAFQDLRVHMSGFSGYSSQFQGQLATVGAVLQKTGIDARTYAANLDIMTRSFGMSAGQARQFSMDFAQLGINIGLPPSELARQLSALTPRIAMYGSTVTRELRKLAAQSKSTGMEMQRLIGITKGFDTFSEAAQKVGSLNAILGGPYLNTIRMMMATDSERLSLVKQSILSSSRMTEVMGGTTRAAHYLRKALADVGGFGGDVDAMMRVLNNDLNQFSANAMHAAGTLGSFQQRAADNTTILEKLQHLLTYFAYRLEGFIGFFRSAADGALSLADSLGSMFIPAVVGAGIAVRGVLGVFGSFSMATTAAAGGVAGIASGSAAAGASVATMGAATRFAILPMGSFAAAIALVGTGIWAATSGVAGLANAMENLNDQDVSNLSMLLWHMTGVISTLGIVGTIAAPGIFAVGQGIAMIGGGVGAAAAGVGFLLGKIKKLNSGAAMDPRGVREYANVMYGAAQGIGALGSAAEQLPTSKVATIRNEVANMSSALNNSNLVLATENMHNVAGAIYRIGDAVQTIDSNKVNAMNQIGHGMKTTAESATSLTPEATRNMQSIAYSTAQYSAAIAEGRGIRDPLLDLIATISRNSSTTGAGGGGGPSGGGGGGGGVHHIHLNVGGAQFGEAVVQVLKGGQFRLVG